MKRWIYTSLVASCLWQSIAWGSEETTVSSILDAEKVARLALALENTPTAQKCFLEEVAKGEGKAHLPLKAAEITSIPDEYQKALLPVPAEHQVSVDTQDIINQTAASKNLQNILYVDLKEFNFSTNPDVQSILNYFNQNELYNLRSLDLSNSTATGLFIENLFGMQESKDKYPSLFVINASGSDINAQNLDTIYAYFSRCSCFIRDMQQFSDRYGVTAAFLSVDVRGVRGVKGRIDDWRKGKKTSVDSTIFYRSKEPAVKGPLIMSVEGGADSPIRMIQRKAEPHINIEIRPGDVTLLEELRTNGYSEENYGTLLRVLQGYGLKELTMLAGYSGMNGSRDFKIMQGSGGYRGKEAVWRKIIESLESINALNVHT